jgi:hypothetical protein
MLYALTCECYTAHFLSGTQSPVRGLVFASATLLAVNFAGLTGYYAFVSLRNAGMGVTVWELENEMMTRLVYDNGLCGNLEDVCGSHWCLWCLPVLPWTGKSNEEIASHYQTYTPELL